MGKNPFVADRRRWQLPKEAWQEWEVPFDTDPDWPQVLREALTEYCAAFRAKMDEVNACIAASADNEELVDQPEVDRKKLRVSGPFTVQNPPKHRSIPIRLSAANRKKIWTHSSLTALRVNPPTPKRISTK